MFSEKANGKWSVGFQFLPVSYINPSSPQTGHSDWYLLHAGFLLRSFFDLKDGGDMFLQNVG
jgi:hypothetical protein